MTLDQQMLAALRALWAVPAPGPRSLQSAPAFIELSELCETRYGRGAARFALSTALRSLGLPCTLPAAHAHLALDPEQAALALDTAFTQTRCVRRHMCPLDLADDLPPLAFGSVRVGRFSADELALLFDAPRLARNFPTKPLSTVGLAQFHWLVVEEDIEIDPRPEARSIPALFMDMSRDLGEIDPHLGRFPQSVEAALFFLLLAPWEAWSTMLEVDWRGFRLPWIYTIDEDLFSWPKPPPDPDSLSLEPWVVQDHDGEDIELERPTTFPLVDEAKAELSRFIEAAWTELRTARVTDLFETPISHFMVRAFLADGMDEVMAHMTAIEAAVGMEADHRKKLLPKTAPHRDLSATDRVAARVAGLLDDPASAQLYKDLFELRSAFVHGRAGLRKVSTPQQVSARELARRTARALVDTAQDGRPRSDTLACLLDKGVAVLAASKAKGSP